MISFSLLRSRTFRAVAGAVAVLCTQAVTAAAQGSISMQGFGYPIGGLSTRSSGTAGALAEFDMLTPRNPASLVGLPRSVISIQAEPEYRSLRLNAVRENTSIQRIPLMMLGLRLSSRAVVSLSDAGFLDRSYTMATTGTALVDDTLLATQDNTTVRGAISDFRAGFGWRVNTRLAVGVAGHVFTGDNKQSMTRRFSDTLTFGTVSDTSGIDFLGRAISIGAQMQLPHGFAASASYRAGGELRGERQNKIIRRAKVPNLLSAGLMYSVTGASFMFDVNHTNWKAMAPLGSSALLTQNATNWSFGTELNGQRVRGNSVGYRLGIAQNNLPFGLNGATVKERRVAAGMSVPLTAVGREQAALDFSLQRAMRTPSVGEARERAWLFGIGFQIRP